MSQIGEIVSWIGELQLGIDISCCLELAYILILMSQAVFETVYIAGIDVFGEILE